MANRGRYYGVLDQVGSSLSTAAPEWDGVGEQQRQDGELYAATVPTEDAIIVIKFPLFCRVQLVYYQLSQLKDVQYEYDRTQGKSAFDVRRTKIEKIRGACMVGCKAKTKRVWSTKDDFRLAEEFLNIAVKNLPTVKK